MKEDTELKRMFFHALKRGTGEAYLLARDNPAIDFSKFIIKGALNNYAYDRQCEDSRAQYIFDLISISKNKEKIRKAVLKGLATERSDTWNLTHLFDLVNIYALQGDAEARQAIYENFLLNPIEGADWVGFSEILELDGFEGLLFIAEKYGKWLEQNPEDWQDSTFISRFQEQNPDIKVLQKLKKAAKENRFIKVYLDNIKRSENRRAQKKYSTPIFTDVVDEVLNSKPFLSFRRKRKLTKSELLGIATQLVLEKNKDNQEKLLEVFDSYPFPLDSEFILQLAKQKSSSKNRIQEYAIEALKHLSSESIRQFAMERIPKSKYPQQFINILYSNYKSGDQKVLTDIAKRLKNDHTIESLAVSFIDVYTKNQTQECQEPLEELYSKMNCGLHRNSLVSLLIENGVLSDKMKEEIKYDSYLDTRELLQN